MTYQWDLVDVRSVFEVSCNATMLIVRRNKTGQAWSVEVKGDTQEWRDIGVNRCTPNKPFLDQPLGSIIKDKPRRWKEMQILPF